MNIYQAAEVVQAVAQACMAVAIVVFVATPRPRK